MEKTILFLKKLSSISHEKILTFFFCFFLITSTAAATGTFIEHLICGGIVLGALVILVPSYNNLLTGYYYHPQVNIGGHMYR